MEWDTYTPTLLSGQSVIVYGTSPVQKISVLPGTTQTFTMILGGNSTPNSLLVLVKDATSGAALEGASVTLSQGGKPRFNADYGRQRLGTKMTGAAAAAGRSTAAPLPMLTTKITVMWMYQLPALSN